MDLMIDIVSLGTRYQVHESLPADPGHLLLYSEAGCAVLFLRNRKRIVGPQGKHLA